MPYITEEIWQRIVPLVYAQHAPSIMLADYPELRITTIDKDNLAKDSLAKDSLEADSLEADSLEADNLDKESLAAIKWIKNIVLAIRNIRGEMNISPKQTITLHVHSPDENDQARFVLHQSLICNMTKIIDVHWITEAVLKTDDALCATARMGDMTLLVPQAKDTVNKEAELKRLEKTLTQIDKDMLHLSQKLAQPEYLQKAPAALIQRDQARLKELEGTKATLMGQREKMNQL